MNSRALMVLSCVMALACAPPVVIESASNSDGEGSSGQGESGEQGSEESGQDSQSGDGDGDPDPTTDDDPNTQPDPSTTDGDGDGDPDPTTGDGDPDPTTGDGDGDPAPTTGDGDGDPDPTTGDGDGDPDPTTGDGDGDGDPQMGLEPLECWDEGDLLSENSDQGVTITWINTSGEVRRTYWLNYQGQRQYYGELQPDAQAMQQTFAGHPWVITDTDDNCVEIYVPDDVDAEAYLN